MLRDGIRLLLLDLSCPKPIARFCRSTRTATFSSQSPATLLFSLFWTSGKLENRCLSLLLGVKSLPFRSSKLLEPRRGSRGHASFRGNYLLFKSLLLQSNFLPPLSESTPCLSLFRTWYSIFDKLFCHFCTIVLHHLAIVFSNQNGAHSRAIPASRMTRASMGHGHPQLS